MTADTVVALLDRQQVPFTEVRSVNWPSAYPYQPQFAFRAAVTEGELLLHYRVEEQTVRAVVAADGGEVWTDSCAECFLRADDGRTYYNIECTCVGTLLIAQGTGRGDRTPLPAEALQGVSRWASLGREPFGVREEPTCWELALAIPLSTLPLVDFALPLQGNVYKCGDGLPVPHFLSWAPISTPEPDFHRPEFFRTLPVVEVRE